MLSETLAWWVRKCWAMRNLRCHQTTKKKETAAKYSSHLALIVSNTSEFSYQLTASRGGTGWSIWSGWVDYVLRCSTILVAQPFSKQPKQKQGEGGTAKKILVSPTILPDQMPLPVCIPLALHSATMRKLLRGAHHRSRMNYAVGQAQACSAPGRSHSKWEILSEGGMFVGRFLPRVSIAAEFHKRLYKGFHFQDSNPTCIARDHTWGASRTILLHQILGKNHGPTNHPTLLWKN